MDLNRALLERTERAKARTRMARAKAKTGTRAARPAQARASAQLVRAHFFGISYTTTAPVRPAWVWKGQLRRRKSTQPKVKEIGRKEKARAKVSSAKERAKGSSERKACMELMREMRPSCSHRPCGPRNDGPKKNTLEQYMMKMINECCGCVYCSEPLLSESGNPLMCLV